MVIAKSNRIVLVFMALLMLMTSTGGAIDMHFCQGQLKSLSVFGVAESCHEPAAMEGCKMHQKVCKAPSNAQDDSCCSNATLEIAQDDTAKIVSDITLDWPQLQFVVAFVHVFVSGDVDLSQVIVPYLNYVPPLLDKDIFVLVQSFLL